MDVVITSVVNVPIVAYATVWEDRDMVPDQRTFIFKNLTGATDIDLKIQDSIDGIAWVDVVVEFTVSAGAIEIKNVTAATSILRVQGKAGGNDRDMQITELKSYVLAPGVSHTLVRPKL